MFAVRVFEAGSDEHVAVLTVVDLLLEDLVLREVAPVLELLRGDHVLQQEELVWLSSWTSGLTILTGRDPKELLCIGTFKLVEDAWLALDEEGDSLNSSVSRSTGPARHP